ESRNGHCVRQSSPILASRPEKRQVVLVLADRRQPRLLRRSAISGRAVALGRPMARQPTALPCHLEHQETRAVSLPPPRLKTGHRTALKLAPRKGPCPLL